MTGSDWHHWCRLCAKDHSDNVNVYFRDGFQTWTNVLAVAIGKHFMVNIKMEDELSNALCQECWTLVEHLIEFGNRVNQVQTLFARLQQAGTESVSCEELREECGVLTGGWKQTIIKSEPAEESETEAEASEDKVDDAVDSLDATIKIEIEATEIVENVYETYKEVTEEAKEIKEEITEQTEDQSEAHNSENEEETLQLSAHYRIQMPDRDATLKHKLVYADDKYFYECTVCQRRFKNISRLKIHSKTHANNNNNTCVCNICGLKLKSFRNLNMHQLVHSDRKQFKCDVCGAAFNHNKTLKAHLIHSHVGTNYICNICDKKFSTRRTLNMHKLVHSEDREFKCDLCGALFKQVKTLKRHLIRHTGLRPFVCKYCRKPFASKSYCQIHMLKMHPNEVQSEDNCANPERVELQRDENSDLPEQEHIKPTLKSFVRSDNKITFGGILDTDEIEYK